MKTVKEFLQVLESYIGRTRSDVTLLDFLYEYNTRGRVPPQWHQDMATQSLGIIINLGEPIKGTEFLAYKGMRFSYFPREDTTRAFLLPKWALTDMKSPPSNICPTLPPGGMVLFDQTRIHRANLRRFEDNKRGRRFIFAGYDTWNGHSGTSTDFGRFL